MSAATAQHQLRQHIYGDVQGYVAVFSGKRGKNGKLNSTRTAYFQWPQDAAKITRETQKESSSSREAYQCAHLLTKKRRIKENAALVRACYVDGDGAQPGPDQPQPTAIIESSPGRHQFYYRLTEAIDPVRAEKINRQLANMMRADMSGWDLTQILRPPDTHNWKYEGGPTVRLISIEDRAYDPDDLERMLPELAAKTVQRAEVKLERVATAVPVGDRDQRVQDRMYAAKRGSEIQHLANGGSVHSKPEGGPNHSADDQSYFNGLAFWFDKDAARMAAEAWRSSRVREKWNEIHSATGATYLEMTVGKAISSCSKSFRDMTGYDAGDAPPQLEVTQPPPPRIMVGNDGASTCQTDEPATLADALALIAHLRQENAELAESNRDLLGWVERTAGFVEELQACNATLSRKLSQEQALRAEDRRLAAAERALGRVKAFSTNQKAAIKAVARISASASSRGEDAPVITRAAIAEDMGAHEATAGAAVKVFDLEGSPIRRVTDYAPRQEGDDPSFRKRITRYQVSDRVSPADIIETMVMVGASQEERVKRYATPRQCPEHPEAKVITQMICGECGLILEAPESSPVPIGVNHSHRDPPRTVDEPVLNTSDSLLSDDSESREPLKFGEHRTIRVTHSDGVRETRTVVSEAAQRRDVDTTDTCRACGQYTVMRRRSGITTCARCGVTIHVAEWANATPWRCACGSLERVGDRCDGCGARELAAVSGGSE